MINWNEFLFGGDESDDEDSDSNIDINVDVEPLVNPSEEDFSIDVETSRAVPLGSAVISKPSGDTDESNGMGLPIETTITWSNTDGGDQSSTDDNDDDVEWVNPADLVKQPVPDFVKRKGPADPQKRSPFKPSPFDPSSPSPPPVNPAPNPSSHEPADWSSPIDFNDYWNEGLEHRPDVLDTLE